jgi:MFS family permease
MAYGTEKIKQAFSSLKIRNYRLYFTSQVISSAGTWMQAIGQSWLVLTLTNSGTALGLTVALQFLPTLILGPWFGVFVDNFSKRKLLYITQSISSILALILGILVITNSVELWMIYILALGFGITNALDSPTRQTFTHELVGKANIFNAISLNSIQVNLTRVVGPMIAALLIANFGLAPLFFYNSISFIAVIVSLSMMDISKLHIHKAENKIRGQLTAGIKYIRSSPVIWTILVMMAIVGTFTYEFSTTLPLIAKFTFKGNATTFALFSSALGIGSILGSIYTANSGQAKISKFIRIAFLFGIFVLLFALAPNLPIALIISMFVGFFSINFINLGSVILQMESSPDMRGRVMSFWTVAFLGTTPIGGPLVGWISQQSSPRWALAVGGIAAIIAGFIGLYVIKSRLEKQKNNLTR